MKEHLEEKDQSYMEWKKTRYGGTHPENCNSAWAKSILDCLEAEYFKDHPQIILNMKFEAHLQVAVNELQRTYPKAYDEKRCRVYSGDAAYKNFIVQLKKSKILWFPAEVKFSPAFLDNFVELTFPNQIFRDGFIKLLNKCSQVFSEEEQDELKKIFPKIFDNNKDAKCLVVPSGKRNEKTLYLPVYIQDDKSFIPLNKNILGKLYRCLNFEQNTHFFKGDKVLCYMGIMPTYESISVRINLNAFKEQSCLHYNYTHSFFEKRRAPKAVVDIITNYHDCNDEYQCHEETEAQTSSSKKKGSCCIS